MARTDNLTNFLTDVAGAIKVKKGTSAAIPAANFDTEIASIDTLNGEQITITPTTSQQVITPSQGKNAITQATVSAVDNTIDSNIVAENIKKDVAILGVTGTLESSEDLSAELNAQDQKIAQLEAVVESVTNPALQNKAFLANGTYTADPGYYGLGEIVVNVPSQGSGDVKLFNSVQEMNNDQNPQINDLAVVYDESTINLQPNKQFSKIIFPKTVVLPEPVEAGNFYEGYIRSYDTDNDMPIIEGDMSLDDFAFFFNAPSIYGANVNVEYRTEDSQTYVRNDEWANYDTDTGLVDLDMLCYVVTEDVPQFNPILGNFVQIITGDFEGLYQYTKERDYTTSGFLDVSSITFDVDMENYEITNLKNSNDYKVFDLETNKSTIETLIKQAFTDYVTRTGVTLTYNIGGALFWKNNQLKLLLLRDTINNAFYTTNIYMAYDTSKNPIGIYIGTANNRDYEVTIYTIDYLNNTISYDGAYYTGQDFGIMLNYIPDTLDLSVGCTLSTRGDIQTMGDVVWEEFAEKISNIYVCYSLDPELLPTEYSETIMKDLYYSTYPMVVKYYPALTQLTLDEQNQLLSGLIGYGRSGTITGTLVAENLTDVLNAQDQVISQIQASLAGKAAMSPNIFVQSTEPTTKNGIWLQKNATPDYYTYDEEVFIGGEWLADGIKANIPYSFTGGRVVVVGTDIYLIGGGQSVAKMYKYNASTDTYTQLTDMPFNFGDGCAIGVGTDIYIFGGIYVSGGNIAYKYNTLTDSYTQLANVPIAWTKSCIGATDTDIYLFGTSSGYSGSNWKRVYKYNIANDSYTQLSDSPSMFFGGASATIANTVYLFGTSETTYGGNDIKAYKYDISTDTYTRLTDIPYGLKSGMCTSLGTDIYIFGGTNGAQKAYKYNTLTDTYTQLTDIPYGCANTGSVALGQKIYIFGNTTSPCNKVQVYNLESKTYTQNNLVVISQGKYNNVGYEIELFNTPKDVVSPKYAFADAWYYTTANGLETDIPTYYGNGTNWVKIKN